VAARRTRDLHELPAYSDSYNGLNANKQTTTWDKITECLFMASSASSYVAIIIAETYHPIVNTL